MAQTQAELKLVELKNCFVNVPRSIVTLLDNAKAVSRPSRTLCTHHSYLARSCRTSSLSYSTRSPRLYKSQNSPMALPTVLSMLDGQE